MAVRPHSYFAICPRGLEAALVAELQGLGARDSRAENGGVAFTGSRELGYAANLHSRLASRVLRQVARRGYTEEQHLYDATQEVRWHGGHS